ncbi:MAG: DUF1385 domain-containing protein [Lachnospiraceae bacterium]|nr:DUF1385 domain-containing protein [Lachnospiraceae bacterium]
MKNSKIGGQAVIEGVMMRNGAKYAVAVRKPDDEIAVELFNIKSSRGKINKIPLVRGVVSFVDSLSIGMKSLTFSSSFFRHPVKLHINKSILIIKNRRFIFKDHSYLRMVKPFQFFPQFDHKLNYHFQYPLNALLLKRELS